MLQRPDLPDERLIACLRDDYGVPIVEVAFLPLGADVNTAVYRAVVSDGAAYFLKLRRGAFDSSSVAIPHFLSTQANAQGRSPIIAPIATRTGQIWTEVDTFTAVLYPFVEGRDGYAVDLTDHQWIELGEALKGIHTAVVPSALTWGIPRETFGSGWREAVMQFQARVESTPFEEPIAADMAAFMRLHSALISDVVERAGRLGAALQAQAPEQVLCNADIHAGNVLITPEGELYVVDWDTLMFAPKEHDLMFFGGGVGGQWQSHHAEALFYQGYGPAAIDRVALAYYRFERIVEDIAAFCDQILTVAGNNEDRQQGLRWFLSQFEPNNVIEAAYRADKLPWPT
jgi:spectinomycin phosphotransferase